MPETLTATLARAGLSGPLAEGVAQRTAARFAAFDRKPAPALLRRELIAELQGLAFVVDDLLLQEAAVAGNATAPTEKPTVAVAGHGTVHRGETKTGMGGSRPHVNLWIDPIPGTGCEYKWFQFQRINVFITPVTGSGRGRVDKKIPLGVERDKTPGMLKTGQRIETAGEVTAVFGRWDRDTVLKRLKALQKSRKRGGLKPCPRFTPPDLERSKLDPNAPTGDVYPDFPIPGTRTIPGGTTPFTGLVDAPDFCTRGRSGTKTSPYERVWRFLYGKRRRTGGKRPAPGQHTIRITVEFRSYLVCVMGKKVTCLGYVPWTYTMVGTVNYRWNASASKANGMQKVWVPAIIPPRGGCTYALTINDWVPCP